MELQLLYDKKVKESLIRRNITKLMLTEYFDHRMFYDQIDTITTQDDQEILDEIEKLYNFSTVKTFKILYNFVIRRWQYFCIVCVF